MRLLLVLLAVLGVALARKSYSGYSVYRVTAENERHLQLLDFLRHKEGFDFWSKGRLLNKPIDIMVSPKYVSYFRDFTKLYDIPSEQIVRDVETVFKAERAHSEAIRKSGKAISFSDYLTYSEINAYLQELVTNYPNLVSVQSIGKSFEGRDINIIKISSNPSANNPVILVDAGIHAREWIAPAQALYIINQLVENAANSDLISNVDWHIIPLLNPDGYEYAWSDDRLWRKTRSTVSSSFCPGVDANRNCDFHWMENGASDYPCDETFAGPVPFSESETQALRDYVLANGSRMKLYLTFHSYGNYLLYPWGYTSQLPDDWQTLDALAQQADAAQQAAGGDPYDIGSSTNVLYAAAGGTDDWCKGVGGIALSYTIEMPGGGSYGFDMPASQIEGTVTTFWPAVRVFGEYIANNFNKQ